MTKHVFQIISHCFPWRVCVRCGLVYLKNEATAKAVKKGCPDD